MLPYNVFENQIHCYISSAGRHDCPKGHGHYLYLFDKTVIHYVESGKGTFTIGGKTYHLKEGDAFYIPLRVRGDYRADEKDPWNYTWIYFRHDSGTRFFEDLGLTPDNPVYTTADPPLITKKFRRLHNMDEDNYRATAHIFDILSAMIATNKNPVPKRKQSGDEFIAACKSYIMLHAARKVTVGDLCSLIKIDRTYLYRLFKSHLHMGPQEYIARTKLEAAEQLLLESPLSIAEIGRAVGFEDPFTFSKQFKKYYGLSPRNYIKQRKIQHETI